VKEWHKWKLNKLIADAIEVDVCCMNEFEHEISRYKVYFRMT